MLEVRAVMLNSLVIFVLMVYLDANPGFLTRGSPKIYNVSSSICTCRTSTIYTDNAGAGADTTIVQFTTVHTAPSNNMRYKKYLRAV